MAFIQSESKYCRQSIIPQICNFVHNRSLWPQICDKICLVTKLCVKNLTLCVKQFFAFQLENFTLGAGFDKYEVCSQFKVLWSNQSYFSCLKVQLFFRQSDKMIIPCLRLKTIFRYGSMSKASRVMAMRLNRVRPITKMSYWSSNPVFQFMPRYQSFITGCK